MKPSDPFDGFIHSYFRPWWWFCVYKTRGRAFPQSNHPQVSVVMGALTRAFVLLAVAVWFKHRNGRSLPLPPGPPGDPVIGHLRYIPAESLAETFAEWSKTYGTLSSTQFSSKNQAHRPLFREGDVMHLQVFNRNMIILNTAEAAIDLMDKRSSIYSDRPDFPIFRMWVLVVSACSLSASIIV